jgi:hypothetical protein
MDHFKKSADQASFKGLSQDDCSEFDMVFPHFLFHAAVRNRDRSAMLEKKLSSTYDVCTTSTDDTQESNHDFAPTGSTQKKAYGAAASADIVNNLIRSPRSISQAYVGARTAGHRTQEDKTWKMQLRELHLHEHSESSDSGSHTTEAAAMRKDQGTIEVGRWSRKQENTESDVEIFDLDLSGEKEGDDDERKTSLRAMYNQYIGSMLDDQARRMMFFVGGLD